MAITKLHKNALPDPLDLTSVDLQIGNDEIVTANIADNNVTHAKLHTDMDLSGKTVTLPNINHDITLNGVVTGDRFINASDSANPWLKGVDTGNNETFFVTQAGLGYFGNYLGIGTKTPTVGLELSGAGNNTRIKLINGSDQVNFGLWDNSNYRLEGDANRKILITSYHTDGIHLGGSGSSHLVVKGGNVGIGATSPDTTLDIRGSGQFRNTNGLLFFTDNGTSGATNVNGGFIGMAHNAGYHVTGDDGGFGSAANSLLIGNYHTGGGDIILATTNSGPYASGRVIIKENGNVGIGTQTPAEKLHVEATNPKIRLLNNSTGQSGLEWWNDYGGIDHVNTSINWNEGSANWEFKSYRSDSQSGYPYGNIQFYNGSNSSPTLKMNINTAGHVTMPHQPGFAAVRSSDYNYTGGTGYNTISGWWNSTTKQSFSTGDFNHSTGVFTAPVSGKYTFKFQVLLSGVNSGDDSIHVAFYTNGGITQYGNIRAPGSSASSVVGYGAYLPVIGSTDVYLSASDSVDLRMSSSGNISVYGGSDWSRFSGYLIG